MEIAARFLAARPRTRWEVERRLRRAGVEEQMLASTLDRLAALGYLDDTAFVRWWAEQRDRHAPRGRRLVEAELRQRGVSHELLASLRDEELGLPPTDSVDLPVTEAARAQIALARHLRNGPLPDDARARQRAYAYLVRRGFDSETAWAALRGAGASDEGTS